MIILANKVSTYAINRASDLIAIEYNRLLEAEVSPIVRQIGRASCRGRVLRLV